VPISKEARTLGQHAGGLSAAALILSSFHQERPVDGVAAWILLTGTNNAAVLTGLAGMLVTLYFVIRVWDEDLAAKADQLLDQHDVQSRPADHLPEHVGAKLAHNMTLQVGIKHTIALIDFWMPIGLAVTVGAVMWQRIYVFFAEALLTFA
jgi:hypothetical protein